MVVHAFILVTMTYLGSGSYGTTGIQYSAPMTEQSCKEILRNVNAMDLQYQWSKIDARCIPVDLISIDVKK